MKFAVALIGLAVAAPVLAQVPVQPSPAPADAAAQIEPVRLAAAKPVIDRLWPLGTYRRLMDGTMSKMIDGVMDQMFQMRASDIAPAKAGTEDKTMGEVAQSRDPDFRERMRITTDVMFKEMMPMFDRVEPSIREAMTKIYARKFTAAQLGDLDRFFQTPTGALYAREWMAAYMDPEMLKGMQAFVPEMMKAMPAIMTKVEAATKHLPPPPKPKSDQ
ncbi:MAG: DUF2059 domain-containing protein [Pseudomonadota bacterium]